MKIMFNASGPSRIEVLLKPGDQLDVNPELGSWLLAASPQLREVAPAPKAKAKAAGKGKGSSDD